MIRGKGKLTYTSNLESYPIKEDLSAIDKKNIEKLYVYTFSYRKNTY